MRNQVKTFANTTASRNQNYSDLFDTKNPLNLEQCDEIDQILWSLVVKGFETKSNVPRGTLSRFDDLRFKPNIRSCSQKTKVANAVNLNS